MVRPTISTGNRPPSRCRSTSRYRRSRGSVIESDAAYWVVYTEREDGVCVEPQTGPPNGLGTGEHAVVEPGSPLVARMTISWRRPG